MRGFAAKRPFHIDPGISKNICDHRWLRKRLRQEKRAVLSHFQLAYAGRRGYTIVLPLPGSLPNLLAGWEFDSNFTDGGERGWGRAAHDVLLP